MDSSQSTFALIARALAGPPAKAGPLARSTRPVIIDYLNTIIASCGRWTDMSGLCASLCFGRPMGPVIIVTKVMRMCDDDYVEITKRWPNVSVIVCGDEPHVSGRGTPADDMMIDSPSDLLAEADDNMIAMLTLAGTMAGCAPAIMSGDKFRNSKSVFGGIPEYGYSVHWAGREAGARVGDCKKWVARLLDQLADAGVSQCATFGLGKCSLCRVTDESAICSECRVCIRCRQVNIPARAAGLLDDHMRDDSPTS